MDRQPVNADALRRCEFLFWLIGRPTLKQPVRCRGSKVAVLRRADCLQGRATFLENIEASTVVDEHSHLMRRLRILGKVVDTGCVGL